MILHLIIYMRTFNFYKKKTNYYGICINNILCITLNTHVLMLRDIAFQNGDETKI